MEKTITPPKMSKISLNSMSFEIILTMKDKGFRARSSSMAQIANIKNPRPEATSQYSYEHAIQKLIPKIEATLIGTNKKLGQISQNEDGRIVFSVEDIIYKNMQELSQTNNSLDLMISVFAESLKNTLQANTNNVQNLTNVLVNNVIKAAQVEQPIVTETPKVIPFRDVVVEWLQSLLERTKKSYDDEDYLSPNTLESYNRNLWDYLFPYLENNPEYNNIFNFGESNVDELLNMTSCKDTQRVLLLSLKLTFEYAKGKDYIEINPIANKKLKKKKQSINEKSEYDFIEEDQRAKWINCMLKEIHSEDFKNTDAPLAFLFALLHGTRPEETDGLRWMDINFAEDDIYVQNAYKKVGIYDPETMKRIGWKKEDGPLKSLESYRHLSIDLLIKDLLIEHKKEQKAEYKEKGKKWTEKEYVFHNNTGTPFTPDILSKNFTRFVKRNELPHIVKYGLRHSFATHCRNLGMEPEILARLMGHTEYETTQKYYIHVSSKQKKDELQKIQKKDMQKYLEQENKDLTHLQNNIIQYNKKISNLQAVQKEDMTQYLQLNDDALIILKDFILKLQEKEKITA